jgi:ubiquitin-like-conjugating enzyme ATG3
MKEEYEAAGDEVLLDDDDDDDGGWLATHGIDRGMEWCCQQNLLGW